MPGLLTLKLEALKDHLSKLLRELGEVRIEI